MFEYIANTFRSGTKESFTRVSSALIILVGCTAFMIVIIVICLNINTVELLDASALLIAIGTFVAIGVTGKYQGSKLELNNTVLQDPQTLNPQTNELNTKHPE